MCYLGQNYLKSQRTKRISILKTTETLFTVRKTYLNTTYAYTLFFKTTETLFNTT